MFIKEWQMKEIIVKQYQTVVLQAVTNGIEVTEKDAMKVTGIF